MKQDFRFTCPIRVRYSEIDWQRMVFNSRYLDYLDVAMTEYLRHLGIDYTQMVLEGGCDPSTVRTTLEFRSPAYFDDLLDVYARVSRLGNSSFTMQFEIYRQATEELVLAAETVYVNYDTSTRKSRPIPDYLRQRIADFEGIAAGPGTV